MLLSINTYFCDGVVHCIDDISIYQYAKNYQNTVDSRYLDLAYLD